MKIAYVNEFPGQLELESFIQAYAQEGKLQLQEASCVISVYDEHELIGIGSLQDEIQVHVLPAYRHREIEVNVSKLLKAEYKYSAVLNR